MRHRNLLELPGWMYRTLEKARNVTRSHGTRISNPRPSIRRNLISPRSEQTQPYRDLALDLIFPDVESANVDNSRKLGTRRILIFSKHAGALQRSDYQKSNVSIVAGSKERTRTSRLPFGSPSLRTSPFSRSSFSLFLLKVFVL